MILNERETPKGLLVAACDRAVLGETFENGEVSLTVTEEFYGDTRVDATDVIDSLRQAKVANLVGVEVVELAIAHGFVDETQVLEVGGTLHAQILRME